MMRTRAMGIEDPAISFAEIPLHVSRHKFRERRPDMEIAHSCISPAKYVPERERDEEAARKQYFFRD